VVRLEFLSAEQSDTTVTAISYDRPRDKTVPGI